MNNTMNSRTKTALLGSIKKWEDIVAGTAVDNGTGNCPLCQEFYKDCCRRCPVVAKTGYEYCKFSPYYKFSAKFYGMKLSDIPPESQEEFLELARAELDFLKSLLPEDN